jgi:hypothetical protein
MELLYEGLCLKTVVSLRRARRCPVLMKNDRILQRLKKPQRKHLFCSHLSHPTGLKSLFDARDGENLLLPN